MMSKAVTPRDAKVLSGETLGDSFVGSLLLGARLDSENACEGQ